MERGKKEEEQNKVIVVDFSKEEVSTWLQTVLNKEKELFDELAKL